MSGFAAKVERGQSVALSVVEGDLLIDGGTVEAEGGTVEVRGTVEVKHKGTIKGNLKAEALTGDGTIGVEGDLDAEDVRLEDGASLEVGGNLTSVLVDVPRALKVRGASKATDVRVGGEAEFGGDAVVEEIHVGGTLRAAKITGEDISVGGTLEAKEMKCEDIKVGGTLRAERLAAESVTVGGTATITVEGVIKNLNVGGTVHLEKGTIEDAKVGGAMESGGAVKFEDLDVGGQLRLESGMGESVKVGGLLEIQHDLVLEDRLTVGGEARVGGRLEAESVDVGGNLSSVEVHGHDMVKVGQSITTNKGVKGAVVSVGRRGRATGPIVGEKVRIESDSVVEDVYADELKIGASSSVGNVFAAEVEVGDGCVVSGRLLYTGEVRIGRNVQLSSQPEKVSSLPGPPT